MEALISAALVGFAVGVAVQRVLDKLLQGKEARRYQS